MYERFAPDDYLSLMTAMDGGDKGLMKYLVDPKSHFVIVYNYVVVIRRRFLGRSEEIVYDRSLAGFNKFEKVAIQSGVVEALFELAKRAGTTKDAANRSWCAADALWKLMMLGNPEEKQRLLKRFLDCGVIDFCLWGARNAPLISHRHVAMDGLRNLAFECFLEKHLSLEKISEIIRSCCECVLEGHEHWVKQARDPTTTWQSMYFFGADKSQASPNKAAQFAPRYYATFQSSAMWTVNQLVCSHPLPEQTWYNDLMKYDPKVLDLLLECTNVPRSPWLADIDVDVRAVWSLVLLVNLSTEMMPGLPVEVADERVEERINGRWRALMEGVGILVSRPRWHQTLVDVWTRLDKEDVNELRRMLIEAPQKYHAQLPFDAEDLEDIVKGRAMAKLALLRLMSTIALASDCNENIWSEELLSLLPLAHATCQIDLALYTGAPRDSLGFIEAHTLLFHKPVIEKVHGPVDYEEILQVNTIFVTGPTCHFRLLVGLAKRGVLGLIPTWKDLPSGLSVPGGLEALKQITSDEEIKRCILVAIQAMVTHRLAANEQFRAKARIPLARFQYWTIAQLAAAVVEFDEVTGGKYHEAAIGARKELVINLGNAAEMSLGQAYFDRALVFSSAAVKYEARCSGRDEIETSLAQKNVRRVRRAKEKLYRG